MSRFNLIDEKWIPVRYPDGGRDELGIRDTLLRAKDITAIEDPSPLVVAALHRFLLAVLYRALEGPTDIEQAKALFRTGIPEEKIAAYLETWRPRFWLFDKEYPFFQIPTYNPREENGWRAWTTIAAEHNADNAKVLFDHIDINHAGAISEHDATRWLIAAQTFALGGGNSDFGYTSSAPSASSVMAVPLGRNLEDTLLLSLVPQNREITLCDLPVWEREPESIEQLKNGVERSISGYADLYTWRNRAIRLKPANSIELSKLAFAAGIKCVSKESLNE